MGRRKNEPIDVFKYIDIPQDGDTEPCWPWIGGTGGRENDKRGYFTIGGIKYLAYRIVYKLVYGDLPDDVIIRHTCDNGICCNPTHLVKGTQSDNERDKYERDRWGFPKRVIEAIMKYSNQGIYQKEVAYIVSEEFGILVSQQRVSDITTGVRRERQSKLIQKRLDKEDET